MKIKGEVLGQDSVFEDIVEETFVPGSEPDGVVGEVGVRAVRAKINQEEGHAVAHRIEFAIGPFMSCGCWNFFLIEVGHVGVRHHNLGPQRFA